MKFPSDISHALQFASNNLGPYLALQNSGAIGEETSEILLMGGRGCRVPRRLADLYQPARVVPGQYMIRGNTLKIHNQASF